MAESKEKPAESATPPASKRDTFRARFAERYPDTEIDDDEIVYQQIMDDYDRLDRSDRASEELGSLLASDPRSAGFMMIMRQGGNPVEYLLEHYGDEFREALADPERAQEFAAAQAKYSEKLAKNKELQATAEANISRMLEELDRAAADGEFSDEEAQKAYDRLYGDRGLFERLVSNDITYDDWIREMKAGRYDEMMAANEAAVAQARAEGEIDGRNAQINAGKRKRTAVEGMPASIPSNGAPPSERDIPESIKALDKLQKPSVWGNKKI
ncbi:MAG: hypothetical protein LBM61_07440 [Prevotellaceae bacterium]|jgi:hypothetical protein|nr:hypothetical protein [Prevotellaceae bacterium]